MSGTGTTLFRDFMVAEKPLENRPWFEKMQVELYEGASSSAYLGNTVFASVILALCLDENLSLGLAAIVIAVSVLITATRKVAFWRFLGVQAPLVAVRCHAILAGIGWGGLIGGLVGFGLVDHIGPLGVMGAGLVILGSASFALIPNAANTYIGVWTALCAGGFLLRGGSETNEIAALLVFFALMSVTLCKFTFASFATRVLRERELKDTADTVKLLLNDFAEQSSDWLWESSGETGRLINVSDRAAQASGRTKEELSSMTAIKIFDAGHERDILLNLFKRKEHFRDVIVPVTVEGEQRWWSVSGRPSIDDDGTFLGYRGAVSDVTDAKRAEAQIAHMASYDALTALPNRTFFADTLSRALARRLDNRLTAVLYLDLDNFKSINDMLGHSVGDQVLKSAAARLEACLGLNDMVSRQGGDEFAVMLIDLKAQSEAEDVAAKILRALALPIMIEGQQINTGASIGIAFAPHDATNSADLIKNADMALYNAKEKGRGRWSLFEIDMHAAKQARRQIEIDLRSAIIRDELELYYQPLVTIETGETSGYEALLRWNHPELGLVMPDMFIPVAEETGLIVPLGEWVIRNALMEMRRWPERFAVSVNLSPAQLRSPNLLPTVINALAASGVASNRLEMEITETVLMQDSEANLAVLHQLRALGIHIALDDFGTGYSSLNYLRSFPFDKIKIDRCFVDEVDSRNDSRAIVRAVTGLANTLGMVTTAEGVERKDQLDELRREGCTAVQGYYFSRPMPASFVEGRTGELLATTGAVIALPEPKPQEQLPQETERPQRRVGAS